MYCPHGNCSDDEISRLFSAVGETALVDGDFNGHSPQWESRCLRPNRAGVALEELLANEDRFQLTTPRNLTTRRNHYTFSTIDLTFTTADIAETATRLGPRNWTSNHLPIITEINEGPELVENPIPKWNFVDHNWTMWNDYFEELLTESGFLENNNIREAYGLFYAALMEASNNYFKPRDLANTGEPPRHGGIETVVKHYRQQETNVGNG